MELEDFKAGLSRFCTGVTILTTSDGDGAPHGFTATSFSSLSLEPPLVLFSLGRDASVFAAFEHCPRFAVNILSREQSELSALFARTGVDRFTGTETRAGEGGVPLLAGCLANLECRTRENLPGGDHRIIVGEVERVHLGRGEPLLYYRGHYGGLADLPPG